MSTVAGIFNSRTDAERAAEELRTIGIAADNISILAPGTTDGAVEAAVSTSESEQPGMGSALGGVVGGAMGAASGATMGAVAASLLVPGVGPVIAVGIIGAALLGAAGGAALGSATGGALEETIEGLPHDELYVYEDALRKRRTVIIAVAADELQGDAARSVLTQAGAESIDAARNEWWVGLRPAEEAEYNAHGKDFKKDEAVYFRGFEAALHSHARGKSYEDRADVLRKQFGDDCTSEAFMSGYNRGSQHYRGLREKHRN